MAELKPCPFCGSTNLIASDTVKHKVSNGVKFPERVAFVECMTCSAAAGFYTTKEYGVKIALEKAIEAWNRRADDEHID